MVSQKDTLTAGRTTGDVDVGTGIGSELTLTSGAALAGSLVGGRTSSKSDPPRREMETDGHLGAAQSGVRADPDSLPVICMPIPSHDPQGQLDSHAPGHAAAIKRSTTISNTVACDAKDEHPYALPQDTVDSQTQSTCSLSVCSMPPFD